MQPGGSERELAVGWEAEAVAAAEPAAAAEQVRVDAGASGEPERKAREEPAKDLVLVQPRATEEGDAPILPRPPPARPVSRPKPAPAPCLWPQGKPRSKGRSCKRSSSRGSGEYHSLRPVTVDSSKARTSLDALKISIRQLQWKEVYLLSTYRGTLGQWNSLYVGGRKTLGLTCHLAIVTLSRLLRLLSLLPPL